MTNVQNLGLNLLDAIILLVMALGLIRGFRTGFIRVILGLAGFVLGFWGAATWATSVVQFSERWFRMVTAISSVMRKYIEIPAEVALMPVKSLGVSDIMNRLLTLPLPADLKSSVARYLTSLLYNIDTVSTSTVGDFLYKAFASLCLHAIAFILILCVVRGIAVVMADVLAQTIASGTGGALTNRLLGGFIGMTQAVAVMVAFVGLASPLANLSGSANLANLFSKSIIAPVLSRAFMWAINTLGGGL